MQLLIDGDGSVWCLYDQALDLRSFGTLSIRRASHVEPDEHGRWLADMSPVAGPMLGPFAARSEALAAETAWLEEHWLCAAPVPLMTAKQTTADVFLLALKALPKKERDAVLLQIAADRSRRQELFDLAVIEERRDEPSRPFREYRADVQAR
jgi:hypothetical protein